jgi:hypothetical protein
MVRTVETQVFKFSELSDRAKEKARDWWRSCESQEFEPDYLYDDFTECARILGIYFSQDSVKLMGGGTRGAPRIYWSGFSSQGDGASFEGGYSYAKGAPKAIRAHAPQDTELHRIADTLQALQRKAFYRIEARIKHSGRYYHSHSMDIDVQYSEASWHEIPMHADDIAELMRDFANWMYRQLEAEYEYRMSDENVDECITINEYEFTEEGKIT